MGLERKGSQSLKKYFLKLVSKWGSTWASLFAISSQRVMDRVGEMLSFVETIIIHKTHVL